LLGTVSSGADDDIRRATSIIKKHRTKIETLIATLEEDESLDAEAIKTYLDPDDKVTPFKPNKKTKDA